MRDPVVWRARQEEPELARGVDRWVVVACRTYGFVLRALPSRARRRNGHAMQALFERLAVEARPRGRFSVLRVLLAGSLDVLIEAILLRRPTREPSGFGRADPVGTSRHGQLVDTLMLDLRYAVRSLRRRPLFTTLAVATFALGIGANTAIFGVVHSVLVRDLSYDQPDRIVRFMGQRRGEGNREGTLSYLNFRDTYARSTSFVAGSAYDEWRPNVTGGGVPELIDAAQVNPGFFDVFGQPPAAGRYFLPSEDEDGFDRVVVLSWGFWQRRYGGDPGMVGSEIVLNGNAHTVVGVAARDFEDPLLSGNSWGRPELWRPLGYVGIPEDSQPSRGSSSYVAVARLKAGVTLERAQAEVAMHAAALEAEFPEQNEGVSMTAVPLRDAIVGDVRSSLILLLGAVGFVLAIAAANVGNLLLGRAAERREEIAVRSALGASRGRIVSQTVVEALALAVLGGIIGVGLAIGTTGLLGELAADFVPRSDTIGIHLAVLAFAVAVTLAAGLACGVLPAMLVASADPRASLGESARGASGSRRSGRIRRGLVVAEVALAILLLVGAGLLGRSLWKLMQVDVGIDTTNLLTFDLAPSVAAYPDADAVSALYAELLSRLEALPGVAVVSSVNIAPLTGSFDCTTVRVPGRDAAGEDRVCPEVRTVMSNYFSAAGVQLGEGRAVGDMDRSGLPPVAVVTEAMARALWPGESALGQRFILSDTIVEVVGIAPDVKHLRIEDAAPPMVFVHADQAIVPWHGRRMTVVIRARTDPMVLAPSVRTTLQSIDDELPLRNLRTMEAVVSRAAAAPRFRTILLGSFAGLALLLATIGIYGVVSYSVSRRTRELAIRMALGARAVGVVRLVLRDGLIPVGLGVGVGLAAAFAMSRVLAAVLFGVTATDRLVFIGVPAVLLVVATAATLVPARRATRADPMNVLRES